MKSEDQRNLLLAIVLSVVILFSFQLLNPPPEPPPQTAQESGETTPQAAPQVPGAEVPGSPPGAIAGSAPDPAIQDRTSLLKDTPRITIATPRLSGSISLDGGRIDDLILTQYRETLDEGSPQIELLHPLGTEQAYYADFGWSGGQAELTLPGPDTRWEATGARLEPGSPVTLSWDNGQGLRFERIYEVDENYLFTVTQRVVNQTGEQLTLSPYGLISRRGTPEVLGFYILHEGFTGAFNEELEEEDYDDLKDDAERGRAVRDYESTGGWLGITDKYWMVALIPEQDQSFTGRYVYTAANGADKYQVDYLREGLTLPAGGQVEATSRLFAGAKVVEIIEGYQEAFNITLFDRSVDFGWFFFLTIPLFHLLSYFNGLLGNFGLAILALTVVIKLVFFPLANKSYRAMAKMRNLQPEMVKLRERFGDDRQGLNQEMMALYKREKVNPMAGCLPVLIQIPVFFALYKVLFVTIEMRHAPFYGWVEDLSAQDPTSILNGFGFLPWSIPDLGFFAFFSIGVWPLLMGLTMFLQTKLNPQPADPVQAKIFTWMPVFFMFLLAPFPAGLVIYWTWNNVLSILQQYVIMKRAGAQIGGKAAPITPPATTETPSGGGDAAVPEDKGDKEGEETQDRPAARRRKSAGNGEARVRSGKKKKKRNAERAQNGSYEPDKARRGKRTQDRNDDSRAEADDPDNR